MTYIKDRHDIFYALCRRYEVDKLYIFGSSITSSFNKEISDVDLLVQLAIEKPEDRGIALITLWDKLEIFFDRKVDLLTDDSLKNPYLKENIDRTKKLIYDRKREQIFI
ncbi:nucleotidyltransferase family protein [Flavimarina sp. Hel_I_48]|uniref:nucleotidyltransferase family protein n=1 Tax=Flavimarina sp. Hel_I_48 TaxID=1392488 RepID=UPI00056AA266|nr:nucleotidyltransferase domain-containing protein [Flavimarina sp. Hel_I_48]